MLQVKLDNILVVESEEEKKNQFPSKKINTNGCIEDIYGSFEHRSTFEDYFN